MNEACPFICRNGYTVTPGCFMSMMKYDRPACFFWSQSVRASNRPQRALCALVVHTFCPFTTHWLPRISARVTAPATSDPLPGSENNWHQVSSPVIIGSRNFSLCISVPWARIVAAASTRIPASAGPMAPARANSSFTTGTRPTGRSRPYQRDGQCGLPQPDSASLWRHSTKPRFGSQLASSQARHSARTVSSFNSLMIRSLRPPSSSSSVRDGRMHRRTEHPSFWRACTKGGCRYPR